MDTHKTLFTIVIKTSRLNMLTSTCTLGSQNSQHISSNHPSVISGADANLLSSHLPRVLLLNAGGRHYLLGTAAHDLYYIDDLCLEARKPQHTAFQEPVLCDTLLSSDSLALSKKQETGATELWKFELCRFLLLIRADSPSVPFNERPEASQVLQVGAGDKTLSAR